VPYPRTHSWGATSRSRPLEARAEDARRGHGSVLLVGGEPAIGKTRLIEEVSDRATGSGMPVLWGSCWPEEGGPGSQDVRLCISPSITGDGVDDTQVSKENQAGRHTENRRRHPNVGMSSSLGRRPHDEGDQEGDREWSGGGPEMILRVLSIRIDVAREHRLRRVGDRNEGEDGHQFLMAH